MFILCLFKKNRYLIFTVRIIFTYTKIRVKSYSYTVGAITPLKMTDLFCVTRTLCTPERRDCYEHWILNNTSEWLKLNEKIAYDKIYLCSTCTVYEKVVPTLLSMHKFFLRKVPFLWYMYKFELLNSDCIFFFFLIWGWTVMISNLFIILGKDN